MQPAASGAVGIAEDRRRGRGAGINPTGRFEPETREILDDGWGSVEELPAFRTEVREERARSLITRNESPDISFDRSINTYRGCEHGCIYCFARPNHSYVGLSAGLDFETKLFAKVNAAEALERDLSAPNYRPQAIAFGTATDPYQPIERERRLTRAVLEVLARTKHPVGIVTKSALVTRDIDILAPMAAQGLVKVAISVTTLDRKLARAMEPRASTPERRLAAIKALSDAGIPTTVMTAPVIPALNDSEIEAILEAAREAGATEAGYVLLRLPLEVSDLFKEWLVREYPHRFQHVMSIIRAMRDGKDYDASFGKRMKGSGPYAWTLGRRFELAAKRLGLNQRKLKLRADLFEPPVRGGAQLSLF
ncbi:PA0069 family radical SAM protein [Segnochrobactrum spirostomi]|uniref:PA0069 family radical SAM protein n=1 Tax=Segnochrobactrum spirostomi TaxID=2608987 RepID=A0A6A7Y0C1_9HYPH|nr:PA0069 family radical SAM protein [Segnochrobactrum spirostomi]MQT12175.1 PA0069 family radical SAM protein [Segnochrobactrum spirostomi]